MPLGDGKSLFFLFGSQTGNAENICSMFFDEATNKTKAFPDAQMMTLDEAVKKDSIVFEKATEATLVIVCSTHGDGDFPDANAANFRRWLKKSANAKLDLSHVRYTVLALGDSNYSTFCGAARTVDMKLQAMGATKFYKRGEADDGIPEGLESVIDPWGEGLWPALRNLESTAEKLSVMIADNVVPDLSTPKDTLVLYGGGLSRRLGVALFELVVRYGGKCDIHPLSHLKASNVPRRPQQVIVLYDESRAVKDGIDVLRATLAFAADSSSSKSVTSSSLVDTKLADWISPKHVSKESPLHFSVLDVRLDEANPTGLAPTDAVLPSSVAEAFMQLKASKEYPAGSLSELNTTTPEGKKTNAMSIALSMDNILAWFNNTLKAMPGVLSDDKTTRAVVSATLKDWCASPHLLTQLRDTQGEENAGLSDTPTTTMHQFSEKDGILKSVMAPVAILYGDDGPAALDVSNLISRHAAKNGFPLTVTADMGNYKSVAFPRSATFVFIIGPRRPLAFTKLMKFLSSMQESGKMLNDTVRFAIFGFDDRRLSEHYNSCALELECMLLSLRALKIHATGLADCSSERSVSKVRGQWEDHLWASMKQPKATRCYIDDEGIESTTATTTSAAVAASSSCTEPVVAPAASMNFFPWESVPIVKDVLSKIRVLILYNSTGMAQSVARQLAEDGNATGFAQCTTQDIDHYSVEAIQRTRHVILVTESSPERKLLGGKEFMKFLRHPHNDPDLFSQIRFAVLGLEDESAAFAVSKAEDGGNERREKFKQRTSPAAMLSEYMQALGASRIFPLITIARMSQLHTRALPWCRGVWGAFTSLASADPPALLEASAQASIGVADLFGSSPPTTYSYTTPLDVLGRTTPTLKPQSRRRILFLYGSVEEKVDAETISRSMHREALARGYVARVAPMKHFQRMNFLSSDLVVFVCDSVKTGKGFPENAKKFGTYIQNDHPSNAFSKVQYIVLGIGNVSEGTDFCRAAKLIDSRLTELGSTRFRPTTLANREDTNLDAIVDAWKLSFVALLAEYPLEGTPLLSASTTSLASPLPPMDHVALPAATFQPQDGSPRPSSVVITSPISSNPSTPRLGSTSVANDAPSKILVMYGSQSGNAQAIAEMIQTGLVERNFDTQIGVLKDYNKLNWQEFNLIIVVCSTHGEGDFPENAAAFHRYIRQRGHPEDLLKGMQYAVLALGDTNYSRFCNAGKTIDRRMEDLGAKRVFARGDADDGMGMEDVVEPWKEGILAMVQKTMRPKLVPKVVITPSKILVMYGSQSGNAQAIAEMIQTGLVERNFDTQIGVLKDYNKLNWQEFNLIIVVCSTHGEGDFPENAAAFHRYIRQRGHPEDLLKGMQYAVLALGDTNYSRFCNAGKTIDRRMEDLGAKRVFARGDADDGMGMEDVVEPWKEGILAMVQKTMQPKSLPDLDLTTGSGRGRGGSSTSRGSNSRSNTPTPVSAPPTALSSSITSAVITFPEEESAPLGPNITATIGAWRHLTTPESTSEVIHMSLTIPKDVNWNPGSAIAIMPVNDESIVDRFLELADVLPNDPFLPPDSLGVNPMFPSSPIYQRLRYPVTNKEVLSHFVSLHIHNRQILKVLKEHATHASDRSLVNTWCQGSNFDEWKSSSAQGSQRPTIVTLLEQLKASKVPFRHIIEHLMPLQPRYYSIASAKGASSTLDIAFKVVSDGVCTNWLKQKCLSHSEGQQMDILIRFRVASEFSMPADQQTPMILIGPGTGVTPFMSFLQHRDHTKTLTNGDKVGETHLFFGCRSSAYDYLFQSELEAFNDSNILAGLHVAFSQEPSGGLWYGGSYVQDKLQGVASHLCNLIMKEQAYIFVCGDASSMARDVHRVLIDMLVDYNRWPVEEASAFVEKLNDEGRYQRDIWS